MLLLFALAISMTACGDQASEARTGNANGGAYKLPEPITVIDKKDDSQEKVEDVSDQKLEIKAWDGEKTSDIFHGDGYDIEFRLDNTWQGGFNATVIISNTSDMDLTNWELVFGYPDDLKSSKASIWNVDVKKSGSSFSFKCLDWNSRIGVGAKVDFGMSVQMDFKGFPTAYAFTCDRVEPNSPEASGANDQGTQNPTVDPANPEAEPTDSTETETPDAKEDTIEEAKVTKGAQFKKHGKLKVKGRYIVDKNNKAYRIKGISTHGIAWFPEYVNKSAFNSFRKWGCNTVRLACYSSQGEGYNTTSCWKTIDKGVKAATELGMYVIIDWHILNENNPLMSTKNAKKFFKHFAKKYGKRKNVIWEICNEPNGCDWKDVKKYAKKIIPLIRKYSNNIIVVGTPTWSQDVDTAANSRLTGKYAKNVCYTIHFYAATHKDNIRDKVKYAFKKKLPILCTEFSICDASGNGSLDKSSANTWMKLFKKYKIGYNTWSLCNKAESSALIKSGCSKKGNFKKSNLTAAGKWFVKTLKKY